MISRMARSAKKAKTRMSSTGNHMLSPTMSTIAITLFKVIQPTGQIFMRFSAARRSGSSVSERRSARRPSRAACRSQIHTQKNTMTQTMKIAMPPT